MALVEKSGEAMSARRQKNAKKQQVARNLERVRNLHEILHIQELRLKRARQVTWLVAAIALLPASLIVLALVIAALGGY